MAAITRKKSSSEFFAGYRAFAIFISIFVYAEMVSAWKNICVPGDVYMDSFTRVPAPVCSNCTTWCKSECSNLVLSMVPDTDKCSIDDPSGNLIKCKCCCETPPTLLSPQKPPPPPSTNEFVGPRPNQFQICVGNQTSQTFERPDGKDCIYKPLCEKTCKEKGLIKARSECVAAGTLYSLTWYEQCCCEKPAPCEADCSILRRLACAVPPLLSCNCCSQSTSGGRSESGA